MRASTELDILELVMLGFEFCGTYSLAPGSACGFVQREPLTTVPKLRAFVEKSEGQNGAKQARRALNSIMPNSASPGETGIAMLLSMPHLLGGYKLEGSKLNYRIDLGKRARTMFGKRYFVSDMCWPEHRLAVEYESDLFHTGTERIANDSKRRNALLFMGYDVVTITRKQVSSFPEFDKVARIIAKHLGKRIRPRTEDFPSKQFALRAVVLGGDSARSGHYLRFAGQNFRSDDHL